MTKKIPSQSEFVIRANMKKLNMPGKNSIIFVLLWVFMQGFTVSH